jgi:predicted HAD superfamily Cof-like phosphohydrolase
VHKVADVASTPPKITLPVPAREVAECLVAEIHDDDIRRLCEKAISPFGSNLETKLRAFHRLYGLPILRPSDAHHDFSHISKERLAARFGLIIEGFQALCEAMGFEANLTFEAQNQKGEIFGGLSAFDAIMMTDDRSLAEIAHATEDLKVFATGFQLENGIPVEEISTEVMCSNLTRLDDDGQATYRGDGKVLKGPNYVAPDCERILRCHGLRTWTNTSATATSTAYPTPVIRSAEELDAIVEADKPIDDAQDSLTAAAAAIVATPGTAARSASDLQEGETKKVAKWVDAEGRPTNDPNHSGRDSMG